MNILILISSLNYGGAEKQAVIDANLLCNNFNVWLGVFKDGPQIELLDKKVHFVRFNKDNYIEAALNIAKFIKSNKINVVHTSLFAPSIIAALSSLFVKVSIVWHFHSHEFDIPWYSNLAFIFCSRFKTVKKIIFVSKELGNFLTNRFFLPQKKLDVIYNSSSVSVISDKIDNRPQNILNSDKNKDISKIIIGYVGRLVKLKRVHYLVELAEYLLKEHIKNFEIWIVGDGDEKINLENFIKNNKLDNYIKLLGFQRDIEGFYKQFDIFVLPSEEECLSIALIDATIFGIPSVAFNVGGNIEIIDNNKSGFIVESKQDLFNKIKLLISNPLLMKEFSENAIKLSKEKFSQAIRKELLIKLSDNAIKK